MRVLSLFLLGMLLVGAAVADQSTAPKEDTGDLSALLAEGMMEQPLPAGSIKEQTVLLAYKQCKDMREYRERFAQNDMGRDGAFRAPQADDGTRWPKFTGKDPLYGRIALTSGAEATTGTAFALDKSDNALDYYDVLYVDLNDNAEFDESERIVGKRGEVNESANEVDFGVLEFPGLGTKQVPVAIRVWAAKPAPDEPVGESGVYQLYGAPWGYLEGNIAIEEKPTPVTICTPGGGGKLGVYDSNVLKIGDSDPVALTRLICYRGLWLDVSVSDDASHLTLMPSKTEMGSISLTLDRDAGKLPGLYLSTATAAGIPLYLPVKEGAPFQLPTGAYPNVSGSAMVIDKDRMSSISFSGLALSIAAGKDIAVKMGKPLQGEITIDGPPAPSKQVRIVFSLHGAAGERYDDVSTDSTTTKHDGLLPLPIKVTVKDAAGTTVLDKLIDWRPGEGEQGGPEGGPQLTWTVPQQARDGDVYTIDVSADTGLLGGVVSATKRLLVDVNAKEKDLTKR